MDYSITYNSGLGMWVLFVVSLPGRKNLNKKSYHMSEQDAEDVLTNLNR